MNNENGSGDHSDNDLDTLMSIRGDDIKGDPKEVIAETIKFFGIVTVALDALSQHQAYHCEQIARLQDEITALKKGMVPLDGEDWTLGSKPIL
jgi:hypothetical protein